MIKKRIIVIDDEPLIPVLMKDVIEEDEGLEISMIATDKKEFLDSIDTDSFDAALVDISVGGREGGLELLQIMKDKALGLPLIVLSAHDELHYATRCLQAGAKGYINKKYICTDVVRCLKQVLDGRLFVSGDKGEQIIKQYQKLHAPVDMKSC